MTLANLTEFINPYDLATVWCAQIVVWGVARAVVSLVALIYPSSAAVVFVDLLAITDIVNCASKAINGRWAVQ
ncbi:MAG: hypothetical protein AAF959_00280 [Cyanobacteria bacterium P01_D01_bin.56]